MEAVESHRRLANRYVLDHAIAAGGMAAVWRATDEVLARPVAIKILRADLSGDPTFARRFQTEAIAAARLTHPNIVSVFDAGEDAGVHYIIMEYFHGSTLREVMEAEPQMDPDRAIGLVVPVLTALAFAHSHEVLHRDIKPSNILIGEGGRVKVTDFGIAKAAFLAQDLRRTGSVLGTVRYVSPEQVDGAPLDARSDLYSVGVVLYEMLTGRPPFAADTDVATAMMRLTADPPAPRDVRPAIPRPLEAVVMRSMARRTDERFHSAEAMGAALERVRSSGEPTPPRGVARVPAHVVAAPRRHRSLRPWLAVLVLIVLVALAALAIGLVVRGGGPGTNASPSTGSGSGGNGGNPVDVRAVRDYDPQSADHSEHSDQAHLAIDGNPRTAWTTSHYSTASFGNLKQGVGLWLDLGGSTEVRRVSIRTPISGWTFQLLPGPYGNPGTALRSTDGSTSFTVHGSSITVEVQPARVSGLLIWITSLAADQGGFAAAVGEVSVLAA